MRGLRKGLFFIGIILLIYLISLGFYKSQLFTYQYDQTLLKRYLLSQDIPHEVPGKRLFLSDDEIHIAAGQLYIQGKDPTVFNFQHPPFIKYLFGLSTHLTGNPYWVQFGFSLLLLWSTFIFTSQLTNVRIGLVASSLLAIDPLFISFSSSALLDLGQAALLMVYLYVSFFKPKRILITGILLGLLFASKFWGGSIFFVFLVFIKRWYDRSLDWKHFIYTFAIAGVVFCFIYLQSFILHSGFFNIVFFQLKTLKYWLHHSVSSMVGSSLLLFLFGYVKTWWGDKQFMRSEIWSIMWPVGLLNSVWISSRMKNKRKHSSTLLAIILPVLYLIYLGYQAPYTRYFILILPFVYIGLAMSLDRIVYRALKSYRQIHRS